MSEVRRGTVGAYTASKGALRQPTRAMRADWARRGIQANALGPGYFRTEPSAALEPDRDFDAWLRRRVPAGRRGKVEELGDAAVFLASRAGGYVDGGMLAVL